MTAATDRTCRRCKTSPGDLVAYWGHWLCSPCAQRTALDLDERGRWPEVPWTDEDWEVLTDG